MIILEIFTLHCLCANQHFIDVGGGSVGNRTQNIVHHPLELASGVSQTHHVHFPLEDSQGGIGTRIGPILGVQWLLMKLSA